MFHYFLHNIIRACKIKGYFLSLILFTALPLISFAQNSDSRILLVYSDLSVCDGPCVDNTEAFRDMCYSGLSNSGLFKSIIEYSDYYDIDNIKTYCENRQMSFYMMSHVVSRLDLNGNYKYKIRFTLYDLDNTEIVNPRLNFTISIRKPGLSNDNIQERLKSELDHFNRNGYKFKEVVIVEDFKDLESSDLDHDKNFPSWMVKRLNKTSSTNQNHYFVYVKGGVDEEIDDYFISGTLRLIKSEDSSKDSLRVVFWMNDEDNQVKITVWKYYQENDKATRQRLIKEVIAILQKLELE